MALWNSFSNNFNPTTGFNVFGFLNSLGGNAGGYKPAPAVPAVNPTPPNNTVSSPTVVTSSSAQNAMNNVQAGISNINQQQALQQQNQQGNINKPKSSQDYQKQIEDSLSDIDLGYKDFTKTLDEIKSGTIPYSADELAQIDAIKKSYENARTNQIIANKRAERAGAATGAAIGARFAAGADLAHRAVEEGIQKLKDLDVEGTTKLTEAKTALKDKKLKEAYDAYNVFSDIQKTRSATLNNLYKNASDAERFARQMDLEERKFTEQKMMNKVARDKIYSELSTTSPTASSSTKDNVSNLTALMQNKNIPQGIRTNIADVLSVVSNVRSIAENNTEGKFAGINPLLRLPGFWQGKEGTANRSAIESINLLAQKWASGAALTEKQTEQVKRFTPDRNDTDKQVRNKLNALTDLMYADVRGKLEASGISDFVPIATDYWGSSVNPYASILDAAMGVGQIPGVSNESSSIMSGFNWNSNG